MTVFAKDWRLVVAPVLGVALVLVGVVGCDSGQGIVEPTATMVPDTPTVAVVEPTATKVPSTATPVPPTATIEAEAEEVTAEVDPYVSSLADRVYELTIMLAEELSPRQSATEEELEAAMYLLAEMEELGYEVEMQDFEVTEAGASGSLEVLPGSDGSEPSVTFPGEMGIRTESFSSRLSPSRSGRLRERWSSPVSATTTISTESM